MPMRISGELYEAVLEVWVELEPSSFRNVPSTAVLYYLSSRTHSVDQSRAQDGWRAVSSERAVAVLMSYLVNFRDGLSKRHWTYPRIPHSLLDVIVPTIRILVSLFMSLVSYLSSMVRLQSPHFCGWRAVELLKSNGRTMTSTKRSYSSTGRPVRYL